MKKTLITLLMVLASMASQAQNLQLHYDFGKHIYSDDEGARQNVTATFEHFKADRLGSWYYFIDLDIDGKGMLGAYTEVSREFNFAKTGQKGVFAAHIEYDGGLSRDAGSFQTAGLAGVAWNGHNANFSKTYSIQALYKQFFGQNGNKAYSSFQLTGVWNICFADGKLNFSGFADLWRGQKSSNGHGCLVFLTEPQIWYNVTKQFSLGSEVEISNNFIFQSIAPYANDKCYINPTLAVKYNF